jgi:hypothetical protein
MKLLLPCNRGPEFLVVAIVVLFVAPLTGCGEKAHIRTYTVAKEVVPPGTAARSTPAVAGAVTDRMLTAILPADSQAWFFKVVGPIAAVDKQADEITRFFSSIRLDESGRARWTIPSGWKEDPPRAMRAATFWVPTDDKPLEISVTTLPWRGTPDELLSNVNRWRGQLQLPAIQAPALAEVTRELEAGDAKITLVDLRGQFQGSGMMGGPFSGGAGAGSGAAPGSTNELPAGHPPIDAAGSPQSSAPANTPSDPSLPKFEVPKSWQQRPPASAMRKAEFAIADGQKQAVVTLIDFPTNAGPMIADPLENVNRWRVEVGLPETTKEALDQEAEKMEVGGQPATYVRLVPDANKPEQSQADRATLAAMVTSGDRIWFVKMTGNREVVAAQEDEFKSFLKSFRFSADGGANDGN